CIVVCVSGDSRVDNRKYKDLFNVKARMLKHDEVEYYTGHKVGGVCPFALKEGVKIYLDKSLKKHEYVYPACGSFNSAIRLSLSELERITEYPEWIDVCREDNNA
ncbi:MAG TPA: EBSC protein, partial [Erysipelotrichaceae bacterium]|nr:EBSC protein [Erysipelotrichaceae bacterium]